MESPLNIHDTSPRVSREDLVDPRRLIPHLLRLAAVSAIDLRNNVQRHDLAGRYAAFKPIDPRRLII